MTNPTSTAAGSGIPQDLPTAVDVLPAPEAAQAGGQGTAAPERSDPGAATPHRSTNYRRGRDVEYAARDELRGAGYWLVARTAGSKSKVDLIAIKPGQILLVQCKRSGALPPVEWNALYDLATCLPGVALPVMAEKIPGQVKLAFWTLDARKEIRGARARKTPFLLDEVGGDVA